MADDGFTRRKMGRPCNPENNWPLWTNGQEHHLVPGRDFQVPVRNKQRQLAKYAERHDLGFASWTETNDAGAVRLAFCFSKRGADPANASEPEQLTLAAVAGGHAG